MSGQASDQDFETKWGIEFLRRMGGAPADAADHIEELEAERDRLLEELAEERQQRHDEEDRAVARIMQQKEAYRSVLACSDEFEAENVRLQEKVKRIMNETRQSWEYVNDLEADRDRLREALEAERNPNSEGTLAFHNGILLNDISRLQSAIRDVRDADYAWRQIGDVDNLPRALGRLYAVAGIIEEDKE